MRKELAVIAIAALLFYLAAAGKPESQALTLDLLGAGWDKPEVTVLIDDADQFTQQNMLDIQAAIKDWNDVLSDIDGAPALALIDEGKRADIVVTMQSGDRYPLGQTFTRTVGRLRCVLRSSVIQLNGEALGNELSSAGLRSVARHELGHALGLRHSDDPSDLMYPFFDYNDLLHDNDVIISDYDRDGIDAIYPLPEQCPLPDFLFWEE